MGLFFYTKKGSIISTVDLPTTEIIEPKKVPETKVLGIFLLNVSLENLLFLMKIVC
jgi:hypothetical protein